MLLSRQLIFKIDAVKTTLIITTPDSTCYYKKCPIWIRLNLNINLYKINLSSVFANGINVLTFKSQVYLFTNPLVLSFPFNIIF